MIRTAGIVNPPRVQIVQAVTAEAKLDSRRPRRGGSGTFFLVLIGITCVAMAHVAVQARRVEVALVLAREQTENRAMGEQLRRLRIELERLRDPARLVRLGREKLGMGEPEPGNIRSLRLSGAIPQPLSTPRELRR